MADQAPKEDSGAEAVADSGAVGETDSGARALEDSGAVADSGAGAVADSGAVGGEGTAGAAGEETWLTPEFLRTTLVHGADGSTNLRVTSFHAEPAVGKGENYSSLMLRVRVHFEDTDDNGRGVVAGERSLIIKTMPKSEMARKWLQGGLVFPKEQGIYRVTLPYMQRLLDERLHGWPVARLAPRPILTEAEGIIVLEDLRDQGFRMAKRQKGMDMDHSLLVMRGMATFHALSMAVYEQDPAVVQVKETHYVEENRADLEIFLTGSFESLAKNVEKWSGFEHYADRLRKFGRTFFSVIIDIFEQTNDRFKVLNHGDCWVNNMMFKYSEDEEPIDIRFVDFQMSRFASMALDLQYFLFSSPRPDIRTKNMDEMLSMYHKTLNEVLKGLDCQHRMVSWEDLLEETERVIPYAVMSAGNLLAVAVAEPSEALNMDVTQEQVLSGQVDIFQKALAGKNFGEALRLLLPYFDKHGALR